MNQKYKEKYLKYKTKYFQLKNINNLFGGAEPVQPQWMSDYYFHGTSSVFIPFIKKYGLGRFPDELYLQIKEIYDYSRNMDFPETDKINKFKKNSPLYIEPNWGTKLLPNGIRVHSPMSMRPPEAIYNMQKELRDKNLYNAYFAKDILNAKKYGRNGKLGDAQIFFLSNLREWKERNKENTSITLNPIWMTVNNILKILDPPNKKQIILAIKNTSLEENEGDGFTAFVDNRIIRPDELFVYNPPEDSSIIPLTSYLD
jgi:hypothetical protein